MALNVPKWLPGLECFGRSFNAYVLLLVWTVTPLALYALACVVSVALTFRTDRIGHITSVFLSILSLVHTLICVEMFEIFDCSRYLKSTDGDGSSVHKSYLKSDHSIDCDDPFHEKFQNLTSFFIVVYVAILPIAMLVQKSRQKASLRHQLQAAAGRSLRAARRHRPCLRLLRLVPRQIGRAHV